MTKWPNRHISLIWHVQRSRNLKFHASEFAPSLCFMTH
jgi:hypothetical protein